VSLDALVEQVSRALGEARSLFGAAPAAGEWGSTAALSAGREGVARAVGAAGQSWQGRGAAGYVSGGNDGVAALDSVLGADRGTGAGFDASAGASRSGGTGMDAVINDTRARVAAVAPSTDNPAGKAQLVADLKTQLQRAKALLVASERRNVELAAMIRAAAAGYRSPMAAAMPAIGSGIMGPAMLSGGGVGGLGLPNLAGLTHIAAPISTPHIRYAGPPA
jgi:peptidoglycan DL-endopeptidase CwlO